MQQVTDMRRLLRWSQARLGREAGGVHQTTISNWESGAVTPTETSLIILANAMGAQWELKNRGIKLPEQPAPAEEEDP